VEARDSNDVLLRLQNVRHPGDNVISTMGGQGERTAGESRKDVFA
jgi:hypothetical protein